MQQLSENVFVETAIRGCNHGFVTTTEGVVLIDTPHKPSDVPDLKAEIERHGTLVYVLNTEPHGDHWTGNAFFNVPVVAHEGVRSRILNTDMTQHLAAIAAMGPNENQYLDGYIPNAPVITFQSEMTLHVGNHTFRLIGMPGHTPYQAAVVVEDEGVVFTSDNIFNGVQTWLHEANPDHWMTALRSLGDLPQDVFVPGHGAVCGKDVLAEQGAFIQEWTEYVRDAADRGMTRETCVENLTDLTHRYPMDVGQDGMAPMVMRINVANLYDFVTRTGAHRPAV